MTRILKSSWRSFQTEGRTILVSMPLRLKGHNLNITVVLGILISKQPRKFTDSTTLTDRDKLIVVSNVYLLTAERAFFARFFDKFLHRCQTSSPCFTSSCRAIKARIDTFPSVVTDLRLNVFFAASNNVTYASFSLATADEWVAVWGVRLCVTLPLA